METENEKIEATKKVVLIRDTITDNELAALLGICKATMYKRLKTNGWKKTELALIGNLKTPETDGRE